MTIDASKARVVETIVDAVTGEHVTISRASTTPVSISTGAKGRLAFTDPEGKAVKADVIELDRQPAPPLVLTDVEVLTNTLIKKGVLTQEDIEAGWPEEKIATR